MNALDSLAFFEAQARRMTRLKALVGAEAFERLKASGRTTFGPFAMAEELWVLTFIVDGSDPAWNTNQTIVAPPEKMNSMFDLSKLPHGVRLLKGKQARRFLKWAARQEARYQREQTHKSKFGGNN